MENVGGLYYYTKGLTNISRLQVYLTIAGATE